MKICKPVVVAAVLASTSVYAAQHLMTVNEVLLDGGNNEQFIEFHDPSAEPLAGGPYTVKIYNTSGTMVDTVTLTGLTAGASIFYTAGNAAAKSTYSTVTFGATLTNALPNPGQACFESAANTKIHCVAWGCSTTFVTGAHTAAAPVSAMSLSLSSGALLQFATPTPGAVNSAGTLAGVACPGQMVDAGVTADSGGNNNNADAGTGGGGDDSGCCQSGSSPTGPAFVSLLVLGLIVRRRRV